MGFHSSCHGDLRDPLVLPQQSQVSFQIVRGSVGLLSNYFQGLFSPGRGNLVVFLKLRWIALGLSRVSMGTSGNLSCCLREVKSFKLRAALRIPNNLLQGNRASSLLEVGNSWYLSSFDMDLGVPVEFHQGSQASAHVEV